MILLVIRASNVLRVDELELFNLAYRFWHNRAAEAEHITSLFAEYLDNKTAPPWVVHFARCVLQAYHSGNLEPASFGVYSKYEKIPLDWSMAFQIPVTLPLNDPDDVLIA